MPAQSTSADKKHQAQQARRQAALNSANHRRVRPRAAAVAATAPASNSTVAVSGVFAAQAQTEAAASAPDEALGGIFLSSDPGIEMSGADADSADTELEVLCELADTNPAALGPDLGSVRQLCRNRRKALSSRGKAAIPGKTSAPKRGGNVARAMAYAAGQISGRDLARLRRQEMASKGRGDTPAARPSGRVRPTQAPPKVETGTTLSGQGVTGTQVERTQTVTGNESGTCRAVTGTEYVGAEQFATFCGTQPEPNVPKVGISITGGGRAVSGTEVGRSEKVTGDEQGSCASVTGSE
ncbi:MAG: carboxysome shell protein CsoS2, partial [uncultured Thiotrichaceae bacterium]